MLATLISVTLCAAPAIGSKASRDELLVELLRHAAELLQDEDVLRSGISFLQTEERGAPPDKAAFVRRLRALLSTAPEWGGRGHDRTPVLKELSQLLDQATRLWPEDEKIQLEILWTRAVTMKLAPSASKSEFEKAFSHQVDEAGKRFPRSATVHSYRGKYGALLGLDAVERMRELKRCLQLDPKLTSCRETYEKEATQYRAPACAADALTKDIALYSEEPHGPRIVSVPRGRAMHLSSTPVVTTKDIVLVQNGSTDADTGKPYCEVVLKPEARARFEEATARLAASPNDDPQHLALMVGENVLVAAVIRTRIGGGVFRVSSSNADACAQLCARPMTEREIPEDARLP